jgi:hypothetical protein
MAYSTCKIKNISGAQLTLKGQLYEIAETLTIADNDRVSHASDDAVCDAVVADDIAIHDSEGALTGHAAQIAHLQDY